MADFETTTDVEDCRVWLWGIVPIYAECSQQDMDYGTDVESFLEYVMVNELKVVYFHNLGFDGYFIIDFLLNNGYNHCKNQKLTPLSFTTLISKQKKFYSMTVKFADGHIVEFRDSLKKLTMSVDAIAKTFELPEQKLFMDYKEYRAPGYQPNEHDLRYLSHDLVIVAKALTMQFDSGMKKLTVGSDSLHEFRSLFGGPKVFARTFPVLDKHMDAEIRQAYRGGWVYRDERFAKQIVGPGATYDVNSLYPSVMYYKPLPYDVPKWFRGAPKPDKDYPLFVVSITFTAKLKPNHLPTIQVKSHPIFFETEYVKELAEPETMIVTNIDLELWQKHYDMEILSYNGGWRFRAFTGFFREYIDKWTKIKENSTGGHRAIAKLHLNSLYGKFATNPDITGKVPRLENGVVKLSLSDPEERDPVYTAVGVFITAYGRQITVNAAQANYETFAYADTDSIHILTTGKPNGIIVDESKLGMWKHEHNFDYAMFWRAKTYMERKPGKLSTDSPTYETHIAGLPVHIQNELRFADFEPGKVFHGKLLPKHVPGGIVLTDETYSLK